MRSARWVMAVLSAVGVVGAAHAVQGDGLVPSADAAWPRWQGRLSMGTTTPLLRSDTVNADGASVKLGGASLLGDFYFARSMRGQGSGSGFRATSGVLLGSRAGTLLNASAAAGLSGRSFNVERRSLGGLALPSSAENAPDSGAIPYVGVGYTGLAGKGSWGFSADFGLMAQTPGSAVKLGRAFSGNQSLDDALRDMRFAPLVQVGVSYSF